MKSLHRSYPLRFILIFSFSLLIASVALVFIYTNYYFNKKMAIKSTEILVRDIDRNVVAKVEKSVENTALVLRAYKDERSLLHHNGFAYDREKLEILKRILHLRKNVDQVYIGYGDGLFYELVKKPGGYLNRMIKDGLEKDIYLDETLKPLREVSKKNSYDHRVRSWYKKALTSNDVVFTPPYMFANVGKMGVTFSIKMEDKHSVLAIDSNLESLEGFLKTLVFENIENIFIFDNSGSIYISTKKLQKKRVPEIFFKNKQNSVFTYKVNQNHYVAIYSKIFKGSYLGVIVDLDKVIKPYKEIFLRSLATALGLLLLGIVLVFVISKKLTKTLRMLVLENEKIQKREFEHVALVRTKITEFRLLSHSQVKMARSIAKYQKQLQSLLDAIVQLIAKAIDAKSHYTAGHCERVPILAEMILDKLQSNKPDLFQFKNEDEKEAFRIGAWLHDCGKVTTPEYVVDKATKLETIYNRIHEIRMRFEVLYRDAYIEYLESCVNGDDEQSAKERLQRVQQELQEEFAFVAECNIGGEFMDEAKKARLEQIAKREWMRYFDDTLGLGVVEKKRYPKESQQLPVKERLLADKHSHIVPRDNFDYEEYKRYGFTMKVPKHLYNYGELYNLTIERGTLSEEERFKINEHIIMTIKMLESIPFPNALKDIPKYAGTHHEKLDCSGYPRGLCAKDLSVPERVMAIADIFEALSASDRPYKEAKTVSQALKIMAFMAKDGHIDKDILIFFIQEGVYKEYAKRFLKPSALDEVDEEGIVALIRGENA